MSFFSSVGRFAEQRPWAVELGAAALFLAVGAALMPVAIFYSGVAALGRYEGGSVAQIYSSVFAGIGQGSLASWVVLLGPYGLYLLFKALRAWWRASAGLPNS
jgi:hypothetical protein